MPISISEVARKADVSTATVSRVLNRSPKVNRETKQRVLSVIEKCGYSPRVFRTKTKRIGVIAPPFRRLFRSYFVTEILNAVTDYGFSFEYELIFLPVNILNVDSKELFYILKTENIFFAIFLYGLAGHAPISFLAEKGFPHLLLGGKHHRQERINWIDVNNTLGSKKAVQYLVSLGHKDIAMIATPPYLVTSEERVKGYQEALSEKGINAKEERIIFASGTRPEDGYKSAVELLKHNPLPTAIFAGNDNIALGAYKALSEKGCRIPGDVSVVGFDNIPLAEHLIPSLTTLRTPWEDVGHKAGDLVQRYFSTGTLPLVQEEMETSLIVRNSTGNPRRKRE